MRVQVVDPSAFTPPYDHALCAALARVGADVELITSRFAYSSVAEPDGYVLREHFYRHARGAPGGRVRSLTKLAEHVPDMLRYRRLAGDADVVHFQWLDVQWLDRLLLPAGRSCSPPTTCCHASRGPDRSALSGACTTPSTRWSSIPSTGARSSCRR